MKPHHKIIFTHWKAMGFLNINKGIYWIFHTIYCN
jgi:hypothetical protein